MAEENTKDIVEKLKQLGVTSIHFASKDEFHFAQGLDIDSLKIPSNLENKFFKKTGANPDYIMPLGRAKNSKKNAPSCRTSCKDSLEDKNLTMDWGGNLYLCCFALFRIGNLVEEPLSAIIERAKDDKIIRKIGFQNWLQGIAVSKGRNVLDFIDLKRDKGIAGACAYLFNNKIIEEKYTRGFE